MQVCYALHMTVYVVVGAANLADLCLRHARAMIHHSPAALGAGPAGVPLAAALRAGAFATEKVSASTLCSACDRHKLPAVNRHQDNKCLTPRPIDRCSLTLQAATLQAQAEGFRQLSSQLVWLP